MKLPLKKLKMYYFWYSNAMSKGKKRSEIYIEKNNKTILPNL